MALLRAAGCAFAEAEAGVLRDAFPGPELEAAVHRRTAGVPLEQVVGFTEVDGLRIDVAPGVFVPRRRATVIADIAVAHRPEARVVIDLGCGAGTLAALLRRALPAARVIGTELDPAAVACARRTGARHGFESLEGSWWSALPASLRGCVDLAVSYLPHVPSGQIERIHPDFRRHEPSISVDGGADGLDPWREVIAEARGWLAPDGLLVTLIAPEQESIARRIALQAGFMVASQPSDDDLLLLVSPDADPESDLR